MIVLCLSFQSDVYFSMQTFESNYKIAQCFVLLFYSEKAHVKHGAENFMSLLLRSTFDIIVS